ncbi:ATP-binding protein [Micromonospora marina]|uniref:ATP-binding protein n=1 Tax=Micromonospora marina TaxID=307120 RepID=UPI0034539C59
MTEESFGTLLRAYRGAAGLTLEQLAAASGVSARAISDMERGHSRAPQRRTLSALADALDLSDTDRRRLAVTADRGRTRGGPVGTCEPPRAVPDFVGRGAELHRLRAHLAGATAQGPAPVAVLHGAPGLGKSALAVHAVRELHGQFPDGAYFLDLRGIAAEPVRPEDALARLLPALGVNARRLAQDLPGRSAQLRAALRDRRCLVILDNAGSVTQVRPLLAGTGRSLVLVTSRRALAGIEGALRLALQPFSPAESAQLLTGMVGPATDRATPEAVADVARLCENLPLAVRIAGSRLLSRPGWSMAHLAARLSGADRRLATLTEGDLGVEAAFELSYAQLSGTGRRVFRRLSLVPGPDFDGSLAAVLGQSGPDEIEDHLDELTDLGLLEVDDCYRYRFHDLIRLFAAARLRAEELEAHSAAAHERMVRWLLEAAIAAGSWFAVDPDGTPSTGPAGLDSAEAAQRWLDVESENWFAALRAAAGAGHHRLVVEVAEAMHWYSDTVAHWSRWTDVFRMSQRAAAEVGDDRLTATHLNYLAWALSFCERRHDEAAVVATRAREHAERAGDLREQAWALEYLSRAQRETGDHHAALENVREAAQLFAAGGDHAGYLQALLGVGLMLVDLGRLGEAEAAYEAALRAVEEGPPLPFVTPYTRGETRLRLGVCRALGGRWADADKCFAEALPVLLEVNVPRVSGNAHFWAGRAKQELGEVGPARIHLTRAVELCELAGQEEQAGEARSALAELG